VPFPFAGGSSIPAEKSPADVWAVLVNGAVTGLQELAAIFDDEPMLAGEGEVEAGGAQGSQLLVFGPGEGNGGKRTTAGTIAIPAAPVVIDRMVKQGPVLPGSSR